MTRSSESPTVAIITTILNERGSLRPLLDAFLSQTRPPDEIIVVDGGSTDGTVEILREYSERSGLVRHFVEPGVNIARGRNIAIERCSASIIAVTDGGCRPERDWLQNLVQPLLEDDRFGAVCGERKTDAHGPFEFFAGLLSTARDSPDEENRVFHGRNSAFRKSLWNAAGGYPEWLYTAEDTLFAQRARALGYRVALAPDAVVWWRPRPNLRKLAKQYYLYGRGTGHIGRTSLKSAAYHLRNHGIWTISGLLGFLSPWFWLITAAMLSFIYATLIVPRLKELRVASSDPWREWYVPVMILTRSFFNNLGQVVGLWQYHRVEPFKKNLELYAAGLWHRAGPGEAGARPDPGAAAAADSTTPSPSIPKVRELQG